MPRTATFRAVASIEPFHRPRLLSDASKIRRMQRGRQGDCYAYAVREMFAWADAGKPEPQMTLVHGTVGAIEHAWIERGGFAYDWQMFAVHGGNPQPVAAYLTERAAIVAVRFDLGTVSRMIASGTDHYGPWTADAAKVTH